MLQWYEHGGGLCILSFLLSIIIWVCQAISSTWDGKDYGIPCYSFDKELCSFSKYLHETNTLVMT